MNKRPIIHHTNLKKVRSIEIQSSIFRAYDIRGRYQKEIDQTVFYQIGRATGTYLINELKGRVLTVGNDIRKTSESLSAAFIAGVTSTGVNVVDTGTCSFGQTLFHGWNKSHDLISFITASHLPAEWNGVKFYYGDGVGLPEEELMRIRDLTLSGNAIAADWRESGSIQKVDPRKNYQDFFTAHFRYEKPLRVAVDCGGGSMTLSAVSVLESLGITVVPVFCDPDPLFSVRPSDPKPENLDVLVNKVKTEGCDFGVAFDGDGDRSVIVDEIGNILSADKTGILIGKYGLNNQKGTIIANVECSKAVEEQLRPLGFRIKHIQVGHTFLTLHAKKEQAPLGIESSGHLIIPKYFLFDDALIVPLKIAEILDHRSESLSVLQKEIPMYPRKKVEIQCADAEKFKVIERLKTKFTSQYEEVNTLDGVRVDLDQGWVLIRASNTSPVIRLTVEADSKDQIDELTNKFMVETQEAMSNISPG